MLKKLQEKSFPFIIALSALSVSASAVFYSVYGLSKLFAGASTQVIIMATTLEVAKLVIASLLYQYWTTINKFLRVYFLVACFVLMVITSGGIYGFLSTAYQTTANQSQIAEKELSVIDMKRTRFNESREEYKKEKEIISNTIKDLRTSISNPHQVQYIDRESGQLITTTSSNTSIHPEKPGYTFNDIIKIYDENPNIEEMMLTGGSPTMHPKLVNELTHFS